MKKIEEMLIDASYDDCKTWISKHRENKNTWDEILYACKKDDSGLAKFIKDKQDDDLWVITAEEWKLLVKAMQKVDEQSKSGFIGEPKKPWISVPTSDGSCWVNYKKKLEKDNFTFASISNIEKASQKVVSYLKSDTDQNDPVRGMVVGNVQSGKTANMSGVISMAADYGYNFFIVLTGTIDNLRIQTRNRLIKDLSYAESNLNIVPLDNLSNKTSLPNRLQDLHLNKAKDRYLCVCLKNSTRLKNLLYWLNKDQKAKANLKVLIIDDEADQAGVNTGDVETAEQTTISRLIKNLVFGRDAKDVKRGNYGCMNYIGYTATPYANFLNESGNDTLYPKDFISLLSPSTEYFGPQQIFGMPGINNPLNIVNEISNNDVNEINDDNAIAKGDIPESLKEALLWFSITVSIARLWKLKKPISMLIHTSQKIERHNAVAKIIESFFKNNPYESLKEQFLNVYTKQIGLLTLDDFKDLMPEYNNLENVKDYPEFEEIEPYLKDLLNDNITHIGLEPDSTFTYSTGLHLCVDNCSRKSAEDDSIEMRIVYPDSDNPIMEKTPAFIVVGGATLSRGLTLQGLTTSYFLRNTSQADTLMQMARWFGYRSGYELLQRLWLSNQTKSRFDRLTKLDYDLRQELYSMELKGLSPKDYGPRLDSFPDYRLLVLTAPKKQQSGIQCQTTFYNKTAQTTWFYKDNQIIEENYDKTIKFLNDLGDIDEERIKQLKNPFVQDNSIIWFDVGYEKVIDYLKSLSIPKQAATFDDYDSLKEWYKKEFDKKSMGNWTVIAGGVKKKIHNDVKLDCGLVINLENRSGYKLNSKTDEFYDKYIDLNTIHQPGDRLMDVDCSSMSEYDCSKLKGNDQKFIEKRTEYASKSSPLLVVYIIDKDSEVETGEVKKSAYTRYSLSSLNLSKHIVGYYLYIPYGVGENEGFVTINLKYDFDGKDGETNEA